MLIPMEYRLRLPFHNSGRFCPVHEFDLHSRLFSESKNSCVSCFLKFTEMDSGYEPDS
jgi:hypothetical protein